MDFQTIFTLIYGAVLAWLSLTIIQQGKKLAVMDTKLDAVEKSVEGVNGRIDVFLRTEIDTLKELVKKH